MLGVGRDLCGSSIPTLPLKQGHLQQAAQHRVQAGLEYLQRRRLHSLPGQLVPGFRHPQREEVLPHVQMELPMLQFVLCVNELIFNYPVCSRGDVPNLLSQRSLLAPSSAAHLYPLSRPASLDVVTSIAARKRASKTTKTQDSP